MKTFKTSRIYIEGVTFSVFTICPVNQLIFAIEFSQNPRLFVFDKNLKLIETHNNICELEIISINYNFFANFLMVVCGAPEYQIKLYDLSERKVLMIKNDIEITIDESFKQIITFRNDTNNIIIQNSDNLKLINTHISFEIINNQLSKTLFITEVKDYLSQVIKDNNIKIYNINWDSEGYFFIQDSKNKLFIYNLLKNKISLELKLDSNIIYASRFENNLIVITESG